jgi:hypothetical protein
VLRGARTSFASSLLPLGRELTGLVVNWSTTKTKQARWM